MTLADRAVLARLSDTLQLLSDPKRWLSLLEGWRRQQGAPKATDPHARQLAELSRDLAKANERLGRAADLLPGSEHGADHTTQATNRER